MQNGDEIADLYRANAQFGREFLRKTELVSQEAFGPTTHHPEGKIL